MSIKREINESSLLMNDLDYRHNHDKYQKFDKIMTVGGDNFNSILNNLSVNYDKVLTVNGSGDFALELMKHNSKVLDVFDINILSRHMLNLKIAAIKALNYQEFIDFMYTLFKDENLFKKVIKYLDLETLKYFEGLFKIEKKTAIYNTLLTHKLSGNINILNVAKNNFSFYNEKEYYLLKERLNNSTYRFKEMDLFNPSLDSTYDFMYFSNILHFYDVDNIKKFKSIIPYYLEHLNDNGMIALVYLHAFRGQRRSTYQFDRQSQEWNNDIYYELKNMCYELEVNTSGFGHGTGNKDLVLTLRK